MGYKRISTSSGAFRLRSVAQEKESASLLSKWLIATANGTKFRLRTDSSDYIVARLLEMARLNNINSTYRYRIKSITNTVESAWIETEIDLPPIPPTNLVAQAV